MVKVWFPTFFMRLVKINTSITPSFAKLQVPPSMTKTEIKEYLNKIYSVNVEKVMTANHLGKSVFYYLTFFQTESLAFLFRSMEAVTRQTKNHLIQAKEFQVSVCTFQ